MSNYDFRQLSPHDFEQLARDLLQARDGIVLEGFKSGRDVGIDLVPGQSRPKAGMSIRRKPVQPNPRSNPLFLFHDFNSL
jgi:hypothetical protein